MIIDTPARHLLVIAALLISTLCPAQDKTPEQAAKDSATSWFEALTSGDLKEALAQVAAPFSFDRKQILRTMEEVEKKHEEIIAKKGKREIPKYEIAATREAPALDPSFPAHDVFRFTITGTRDQIDVYVSKGGTPKVIGFSD